MGRERELTGLGHALSEAQRGRGQVVLVEASAGIGKTSLLQAASGTAAEVGFTCLRARASTPACGSCSSRSSRGLRTATTLTDHGGQQPSTLRGTAETTVAEGRIPAATRRAAAPRRTPPPPGTTRPRVMLTRRTSAALHHAA
ncbi:MAG: ATP-binding protein [Pseudonocardia sp.]